MDRVFKRVGLSRRVQSDIKLQESNVIEENIKIRRRRRSKSRRHSAQDNKKTRGLFSIDWEFVKDCKSCKSRAITKRLCGKKCENELYRSNSFKFERFIKGNEETFTLGRKILLCDDYSLPVDDLNKKRPNSIAVPSFSEWNISSPNEEKIEILETYSTPRDSMQQLVQEDIEPKYFTSPDKEYSQPYTAEGSSEFSSDDDIFGHHISVPKLHENSPDSISDVIWPQVNVNSPSNQPDIKRHPSPYYYADLFKTKTEESRSSKAFLKCEKNHSLDKQKRYQKSSESKKIKSCKHQENRISTKKYKKSCSLDNSNCDKLIRAKCRGDNTNYEKSSSGDTQSTDSKDVPKEIMPPNKLTYPCVCFNSENINDDEMTRQKHVYETAFDSQISKSDDDLDNIDKISNHFILVQIDNKTKNVAEPPPDNTQHKSTSSVKHTQEENKQYSNFLSQKLQDMHLRTEELSENSGTLSLSLRSCAPTPPSTAPLPTKFHGKEIIINSTLSAPNLPSHPKSRHKDLHLPVKSLRTRSSPISSSESLQKKLNNETKMDIVSNNPKQEISESALSTDIAKKITTKSDKTKLYHIKNWSKKELLLLKRYKENRKDSILKFSGGRRRRNKYSSTESITTSSSGGSMESIKSSTSEGNRSTTSSESRQSSSLSSHSSDSGGNMNFSANPISTFSTHSNKLHILSPISDKSSQEPISETSDNNKNNNSQKCSPEEVVVSPENGKIKKKQLQNKNLLSINCRGVSSENQGSDSGISIHSREGIKSRIEFMTTELLPVQQDYSNLPFDMPKLRRRRLLSQDPCTSSSATSMDFRDLPFDMPKLRRRLRIQQINPAFNISQASSSQSVIESDRSVMTAFRPKLTLHLGDSSNQRPNLELSLNNPEQVNSSEMIDINLPLEKQSWFHGAITRVEAENVLRVLKEGSFLVRNSESTKQDYSLSLKSTRGFLHMRIQKDDTGECYILGQFSKPFHSIPEMIRHFCINRLPIRGAEHMCLVQPVISQLL